jgi:primosomal replication protein N
VNTVFLSGKVRKTPNVAYTPKGRRIVTFPLWVEKGDFSIEVVGSGDPFPMAIETTVGSSVLVAGELTMAKIKARDVLRLKASKILWMEE